MMFFRSKTYDVLPALSVRGPELRQSLQTITVAWMAGIVWMTCISGSRVNIFGRMLGFSDFHFGLLAALPSVAALCQLPAVILIERRGLRKYQFVYYMLASRLLWLAVAAIPLVLPIPSLWAICAMLMLLLVSWSLSAVAAPAWSTWMGDLIPRRVRGRYFASRNRYANLVKIPLVISLGMFLDHVARRDPASGDFLPMTIEHQPALLWVICAVFVVAGIMGAIDVWFFRRIREVIPSTVDKPRQPAVDIRVGRRRDGSLPGQIAYVFEYSFQAIFQILIVPLKDHVFRRYVYFGALIMFAMSVAGQYFWRNVLENLRFGQVSTDFLFLVVSPLAGMASIKAWGKLIDRWGRRPTLMLAMGLCVVSPIPYFIASRNTPSPQFVIDGANYLAGVVGGWFGHGDLQWLTPQMPVGAWLIITLPMIIGGCGWSGVMLGQTGIILGFADGQGRSKYVAAHAILISTGGILGGLVGGLVAQNLHFLQAEPIVFGTILWNNWHATFALSMLARLAAFVSLIHMPDPGASRFRTMARHLGQSFFGQFTAVATLPLRILGWWRFGKR
ncbi:MAG: MFS transporter [Planctomycetes bacterium]|nr:MFS transporter [Planctomycetota bacterium]